MKKLMQVLQCAVIAAVLLLSVGTAQAALSVYTEYIDGNDMGSGYGFGLSTGFSLMKILDLGLRAGYVEFDAGNTTMVPVEATLTAGLPFILGTRVYGGLGAGYYMFPSGIDLSDEFGYFPLVGAGFSIGPVGVFAEARWLVLQADLNSASDALPNTTTADIDSVGISMGVTLKF